MDIEIFYGMMKSRFEVLIRDNRRWRKEDIVRTRYLCKIIQNILIWTLDAGSIIDEDGCDVIMDLLNLEKDVEMDVQNDRG